MESPNAQNPLVDLGRAMAQRRRSAPKATRSERLRLVDQAIAALASRADLSEAQRARGLDALQKARMRAQDGRSPMP